VEHALDVLVLLERVDHLQDFPGLLLALLDEVLGDVLRLGGVDGQLLGLQRRLQLAELGERAADDELLDALVVGRLAISCRPWSMSSSSSSSRFTLGSGMGRRKTPMRSNRNATLPVLPMLPPCALKCMRTLATVRTMLSVAVSTSTAMPCGA
jgi:hypothetical protein